jgi:hypothetical protein
MEGMLPTVLFFLALGFGIVTLYWVILKNASAKIARQYAVFAHSHDLELNQPEPAMAGFIRPEPSLYGRMKGRELSISVPGKGLQNTRQIETVLKLEIKNQGFAAQLTGAGLLGRFRQRDSRGMDRWKSGDAIFDAAVDVRTNHPGWMNRILDQERRSALAALLKRGKGSIYIGSGVLAYAELGLIANDAVRTRFEEVLQHFHQIADSVEAFS